MEPNDTAFDLDRYLRVCGATKPECFDWTAVQPRLSDDALFTIAYMMDIESHTIVYLRDLLSTRVVRDNEVTTFLSCWAYEEFFTRCCSAAFSRRRTLRSTISVSPICAAEPVSPIASSGPASQSCRASRDILLPCT
jgi:hypothetical protein